MSREWVSLDYAAKLNQNGAGLNPKTKFLFKVAFILNERAGEFFTSLGENFTDVQKNLSYTVKQVTLPKVTYDYEDVNLYNFRTKVLKNIIYDNIDISFYDDVSNFTMSFVDIYFKIFSPLGRFAPLAGDSLQDMGMEFTGQDFSGTKDSARRAAFADFNDILDKVIIYQYSVKNSQAGNLPENLFLNSFTLSNPRILNSSFDEQDHENGNMPSIIQLQLTYDSVYSEINGQDFNRDITLNYQGSIPGIDIAEGATAFSSNQKTSQINSSVKITNQFTVPQPQSEEVTSVLDKSAGTATVAKNRTLASLS